MKSILIFICLRGLVDCTPDFHAVVWGSNPRGSIILHFFSFFSNFEGKKGAYSPCLTMSALVHCFTHNSKIILVYVWQGCVEVQNFDLSKGKSSYLELFHVIFILFTITKILYYHQGIFLYIEACVNTKKWKIKIILKGPPNNCAWVGADTNLRLPGSDQTPIPHNQWY